MYILAMLVFVIVLICFKAAISKHIYLLCMNLFGRRKDRAFISEHPELLQDIDNDCNNDHIIRTLNSWQTYPDGCKASSWSGWKNITDNEHDGLDNASITAVETLFFCLKNQLPPYVLLDTLPDFLGRFLEENKSFNDSNPPLLPESYPSPLLTLPLWGMPCTFLNGLVRKAHSDSIETHQKLLTRKKDLESASIKINAARKEAWKEAITLCNKLKPLKIIKELISNSDLEGLHKHYDLSLRLLGLPNFIPRRWMINYDKETKILLVEHKFPEIAKLQIYKSVSQSKKVVKKPLSKTEHKAIINKIQPALCIQIARGLAEADVFDLVDTIAVNGWVDFYDRATGHPRRAYCTSLIASKQSLLDLRLETVDMVAAFNRLSGANAGLTYETAPLMPSLCLQTDDRRFIEPKATIEKLAKGENLAAMDWEDFEHFVRQLFERVFANNGAEVKITRASRDQGVDAVIFDPDPLRGGKIVIQAKRYTIPVDVSAVRDLYGTVLNEGANTGILVTTSNYGPDAYTFAQNKPIKLINGAQLLGILNDAGYKFRIDLEEARALRVSV